jgi:sialic acid synthase SpsE
MTTIFAKHRIPEVAKLSWPGKWIKVASYDCSALPFIEELAKHFDNFIISTGATYDDEIRAAADLMKKLGKNFAFLHCVTSYPNALSICNLARMEWLRQFTPVVGWSDHTKIEEHDVIAAKVAIYLGADYIERHFTILAPHETKDGPVSMTPELLKGLSDFRALTNDAQKKELDAKHPGWEVALGSPTRDMTDVELRNRDYYRGRFASPRADGTWEYNWE